MLSKGVASDVGMDEETCVALLIKNELSRRCYFVITVYWPMLAIRFTQCLNGLGTTRVAKFYSPVSIVG